MSLFHFYKLPILTFILIISFSFSKTSSAAQDTCKTDFECQSDHFGITSTEIVNYSPPNIRSLFVDQNLLNDRWYQQVNGNVNVFDTPGGTVIRTIESGFNFVTSLTTENDWIQINEGQWVTSNSVVSTNSSISTFSGVLLPEESIQYPVAWILINQYPSKAPGDNPSESNPLLYRYTRVNLFDSVQVEGEHWYQIGVEQWVHQYHLAKIAPITKPVDVDTTLWISIDLYEQTLIAYEDATPIFATLIAAGMDRWPTREGTYHIYYRRLRDDMSGGTVGDDFYSLEEVPWTMFFDEGRALHGAYWHDGFGFRRSHGCVNLSITDAHWLYKWVAGEMGSLVSRDREVGPAVYIYSSGQYH